MQRDPLVLLRHGIVEAGVLIGGEGETLQRRPQLVVLESPGRHAELLEHPVRRRQQCRFASAGKADPQQSPEDVLVDRLQPERCKHADARLTLSRVGW